MTGKISFDVIVNFINLNAELFNYVAVNPNKV